MKPFQANSQANAFIGVGLRHSHYAKALSDFEINNQIDFVEVHAENFFARGGISIELLKDIGEKYALSIHGTSLGLGSQEPVPSDVLDKFAELVRYTNANLVSEHVCFNRANVNGQIVHTGDLLPLAYNRDALQILKTNIEQVQDKLQRPILIENLSAYLNVEDFAENERDDFSETEFLIELCNQSGCGLLLDINNLIVNAINQQKTDIIQHVNKILTQLPPQIIGEIHLAGFSDKQVFGYVVDDHAQAVSEECWLLYQKALSLYGNKPTLIEWDNNLPEWEELVLQANIAREYSSAITNNA